MNTRNTNNRHDSLATGIKVVAIAVVLGTLASTWHPTHPDTAPVVASGEHAVAAAPDLSVYFPDRFPAPQGPDEAQPPTF
ncbi:MAG TPA: hypothetical protein VLN42_10780 [Casimicrobiaceae bacterium]|nr:hypothetical protein [Casimicrobiaceae bacterium]